MFSDQHATLYDSQWMLYHPAPASSLISKRRLTIVISHALPPHTHIHTDVTMCILDSRPASQPADLGPQTVYSNYLTTFLP